MFLCDGHEVEVDSVDQPVQALSDSLAESLTKPGSVITLHSDGDQIVIPVAGVRYVQVKSR